MFLHNPTSWSPRPSSWTAYHSEHLFIYSSAINTSSSYIGQHPYPQQRVTINLEDPTSVQQFLNSEQENPAAAHLPKKAEQAIINGEYVDFASLLLVNTDRGFSRRQ